MYRPISEIQICNRALLHLGVQPITSFTDNNPVAAACGIVYEDSRDELLREHPWNFAMTRATLSPEVVTPPFGFSYQFNLPSDCIRVYRTYYPYIIYQIEGSKLLTNESSISILYIKQITDCNEFDPLFRKALSLKIAVELANPLGRMDIGFIDRLNQLYLGQLANAKVVDSQENQSDLELQVDVIDVR